MTIYSTNIDDKIIVEANNHSKIRMNFEYDRFKLSYKVRRSMILIGTIGQLIFKKFLIQNKIKHEFEYQAGKFDSFDFKINDKIFEIKTSGYNNEFHKLNLLYSKDQYNDELKKDFFCCIQIFINGYNKINKTIDLKICNKASIVGGILYKDIINFKNNKKFYGDDYKVPLKKLLDVKNLLNISHF